MNYANRVNTLMDLGHHNDRASSPYSPAIRHDVEHSSPETLLRRGRDMHDRSEQRYLNSKMSKDGIRSKEVVIIGE